jgi:gliding motility-associated-like protein
MSFISLACSTANSITMNLLCKSRIGFIFSLLLYPFIANSQECGLIFHAPLNGNANDITVAPASVNSNTASLSPDRFGNVQSSYSFNSQKISYAATGKLSIPSGQSVTMSAWIYVRSIFFTPNAIFYLRGTDASGLILYMPGTQYPGISGKLSFLDYYAPTATSNIDLISGAPIVLNQWHHIAATIDKSTLKSVLYLNGLPIDSVTAVSSSVITNGNITLGNHATVSWDYDGLIDDARIYNRALSASEIYNLFLSNPPVSVNAGKDVVIYKGDSVQLSASVSGLSGSGFSWSPSTGLNNPSISTPKASPSSSAQYVVSVSNGACMFRDTVLVSVADPVCSDCNTRLSLNLGLVACYPFNGNANDESGNGNNGTITPGISLTTDRNNSSDKAWAFNNTANAYIDVPASASLNTNAMAGFTFSGWFNAQAPVTGAAQKRIYNLQDGSGRNYELAFDHASNKLVYANYGGSSTAVQFYSRQTFSLNNWYHITVRINSANNTELYINGVIDTFSSSPIVKPLNPTLSIGRHPINGWNFSGKIDDIRIYNRALSMVEIIQLYNLYNPVKANAGADTTICLGDSVRLSASGGPRYAWQPSASVNNDTISNPYASPITTTDYIVTVTDGACSGKDTVKVTVALPVVANTGADRNMCLGDSVRLSAAGGVKYTWSPAALLSNDTIHDPYARPTVTTDYIVTASNSACSDMDTVTVFVSNVVADAGTAGSICQGDSIQLSATGGTQYTWTPAASLSNPSVSNPFARPATTTVYHVQVSDGICTREDSVEITVISPGLLSAGADKIMCEKDSVQLQATGGANYKWYPAIGVSDTLSASPKVSPPVTTEYRVVSAVGACVSGDTVLVTVNPLPAIYAGADLTLCTGGQLTIPAIAVNADRYRWIPASGLDSTSVLRPRADPNATMQYIVEAENTLTGCLNYDTIIVNVNQPVASFMPDVTEGNAPLDVTFTNTSTATGGVHSWYFEDADTTYVTRDPKHRFSKPGTFRVSLLVTDDNGCVDTVSKLIRINDELKVFIPNVFTPNGDGLNDEFAIIYTQQALLGMKGSVWNRWGVKVYEFTMPGGAWWNGEDEGQKCPAGVYQYSIEVVNNRGQLRRYHGTITLVR